MVKPELLSTGSVYRVTAAGIRQVSGRFHEIRKKLPDFSILFKDLLPVIQYALMRPRTLSRKCSVESGNLSKSLFSAHGQAFIYTVEMLT